MLPKMYPPAPPSRTSFVRPQSRSEIATEEFDHCVLLVTGLSVKIVAECLLHRIGVVWDGASWLGPG